MNETFPRRYGRYRLLGVLGAGGMGVVYRAETEPLAGITRTVAIKQMQTGTGVTEKEMVELLLDEARIWVRLQHPNIVSVVDFGREKDDWFLALELIDGMSAQDLLDAEGKLPVTEALGIVERVARALAYAHVLTADDGKKLRIVHRDVKPANILVSLRGEVKLTDFGIARATDRRAETQAGQVRGSLRVMSPEQVRGDPLDARSDLFALGCTLHELVTGRPLLSGSRTDVLTALTTKRIPAPEAGLPPAVRELIVRLTASEPSKRPASAEEVARQARAMLLPETVEDVETAIAARVRRSRSGSVPDAGPPEERNDTTQPRAAEETVPSPSPPPSLVETEPVREMRAPSGTEPLPVGTRPARPWEIPESLKKNAATSEEELEEAGGKPWTFHARIAAVIVVGLLLAWGTVRWIACDQANAGFARARAGAGTLAELGAAASNCLSYCRSTPDRRIGAARGLFFGGASAAEAAAVLEKTPAEQRFAATVRVAMRGWSPGSARTEALALSASPESACLGAALAFDSGAGGSLQVPDGAAGSECGQALALAESMRMGDLDSANELMRRIGDTRAASLAGAVYMSLTGTVPGVEAKIDAALRSRDDEVTGVWIPSSWTLIAGERGRVTTPLDDIPALGAMLAGDTRARTGDFNAAMTLYRQAEARGYKHPDLFARMIDLYLHAERLDGRGQFVRDATVLGDTAARLAVSADARLGSTDGLAARVAMAHLAARDAERAEKALAQIRHEALAATIAADVARVRKLRR